MIRKNKRLLSSALAISIMLFVTLLLSPAAYSAETGDLQLSVTLDKTAVLPGDEVSVKVSFGGYSAASRPIAGLNVELMIDETKLGYVSGSAKTLLAPDSSTICTTVYNAIAKKAIFVYEWDANPLQRSATNMFECQLKVKDDLAKGVSRIEIPVLFKVTYGDSIDIVNIPASNIVITVSGSGAPGGGSGGNTGGGGGASTTSYKESEVADDDTPLIESTGSGTNTVAVTATFADVQSGDWYYNDVLYVASKGYMDGTGGGKFEPNLNLSRAMVVTVLYRLAGSPAVAAGGAFDDVPDGQWYSNAVKWGVHNGVVKGYGNGLFGTNDNVTRQDMAAFVQRYADAANIELTGGGAYNGFTDEAAIADYAADPVRWCVVNSIINGRPDGAFGPRDNATRAEFAAIIHRFMEQ